MATYISYMSSGWPLVKKRMKMTLLKSLPMTALASSTLSHLPSIALPQVRSILSSSVLRIAKAIANFLISLQSQQLTRLTSLLPPKSIMISQAQIPCSSIGAESMISLPQEVWSQDTPFTWMMAMEEDSHRSSIRSDHRHSLRTIWSLI